MLIQKVSYQPFYRALGIAVVTLSIGACGSSNNSSTPDDNASEILGNPGDSSGEETVNASTIDITRFTTGALTSSDVVDCELSDGTAAQCYELVTAGIEKTDDMIGPFCPSSTTSNADGGGVWLDGDTLYEADGDFFLDLPNVYGQTYPPADSWIFYDDNGNIRVTDTLEACQAAARPDVDPEYQSYCVECSLGDLDATDLPLTFLIPVTPVAADTIGNLSGNVGISLNGFQIAARAPVDDILGNWTIAAFDDCGGHVNPNDGYHYHAATGAEGCNSAGTEADGHPALIGYAMDGYGIYGTLTDDDPEAGTLDECNGSEDETRGYHYHASSPETNEHIGCFHGLTTTSADDRPPSRQ